MRPELSIIIVQYKIPELLARCIDSLYAHHGDVAIEVIVVNNDTDDISQEPIMARHPDVKWINAGYNAGFSRANNIGIMQATGDYLLILNPDTEIKGDFLRQFLSAYQALDKDNGLGLLGCRIISSVDGSLLIGSGRGFPSLAKIIRANPVYIYFHRKNAKDKTAFYDPYKMHYTDHEIDFVSGASVMIRRDKLVNGKLFFDEDFFLYSEDVDWAHRIKKAGYRNYFCAQMEVYHVNSASTGFSPAKMAQMQISAYLYYLKAHGILAYLLYGLVLGLNHVMNIYLLRRAGHTAELSAELEQYHVFSQYFFPILKQYYFSKPAGRPYLKYDPKNQK